MILIDVIIPAYKAHGTILRTLSSIQEQSVVDKLNVIIVNDASPDGDYSKFVEMFKPSMNIKEIILDKNGGPGVARQAGIDAGEAPYFTCIDADDTFNGAFAIESMYRVIESDNRCVCASGTFLQMGDGINVVPHKNDMVWVFGKIYRRSFINKYGIRFNETRANEDTGFNTKIKLICSNDDSESICFFDIPVYYWHEKVDSITRVNNCQYSFDQSFCGWTDNMIDAIKFCKRVQPYNGEVDKATVCFLMNLYTYYIETVQKSEVFAEQNWEYVKKFYHSVYKKIDENITEDMLAEAYSIRMRDAYMSGSLFGFFPCMTFKEFINRLRTEEYNPNHIYDVWNKLPNDLKENNIRCGVCSKDHYIEDTEH